MPARRPQSPAGKRLWIKDGAPARGDRGASAREIPEDKDPFGTRSVRPAFDAPEIPAEISAKDLDRMAALELKTLSKDNADAVARHLAMVARTVDEHPELAHRHAQAAARRAGRIGVVRETLAITAYAVGDFALALRELRTYRRISGRDDQLPMMVDSERGMGRPERALELGRSVDAQTLAVDVRVQLAIAMSGARLDLGQLDSALAELEIAQLDPARVFDYSADLFDAYATVLEEVGRESDSATWYAWADAARHALQPHGETVEILEEDVENAPDQGALPADRVTDAERDPGSAE